MIAIAIVIFVIDIIFTVYQNKKRNDVLDQLSRHLAKKEYKAFDELIDDPKTKKVIPPFNVAFLKLNKEIMKNDRKAVDEVFKGFTMRMNKAQKEAVYQKGFYYYLGLEDKKNTTVYYQLLQEVKPANLQMIDVMYDTYILKGSKYIDLLTNEVQKTEKEEDKIPYYALLADVCHNAGEEEKAAEYGQIVSDYTEKLKNEMKK